MVPDPVLDCNLSSTLLDFKYVTDLYTGDTTTVPAAGFTQPQSYKLYRGATMMNLARTKGWQSDPYDIQTFSGVVSSTDGTPDASQNNCCKEATAQDSSGNAISNTLVNQCSQTTTCNSQSISTYYQVRVSALPTYSEVIICSSAPRRP